MKTTPSDCTRGFVVSCITRICTVLQTIDPRVQTHLFFFICIDVCCLSMTLELYSAITAYFFQQSLSLSVFALCWSSLGTPHFLLTLVPNLTSPMSLLDQPHWGISWIWESTAHLTLPPTPLHQSAICISSFMLTLSLSSFLPQKTKNRMEILPPAHACAWVHG